MNNKVYSIALVTFAIILTTLGTLFVHSSSSIESLQAYGNSRTIFNNHLIGVGLALLAGVVGFIIPSSFWQKNATWLYLGGLFLLIITLIPGIGVKINGARRWLSLLGMRIQPVELFKFAFIAFQASWLVKHQRFMPFLATLILPALLIIIQPDLGSTIVISAIALSLYFVAGASLKTIFQVALLALITVVTLIMTSSYRMQRLMSFLDPHQDLTGANFQVHQMTLALGRGGLFGQGIGNSQQKYLYVPESSTDSIFAITAEEVGFLGSTIIILFFIGYTIAGFTIIRSLSDQPYLLLIGTGILTWFMVQTFLNLGAVVVLIPLTGIPLPFFSYGRTSQVMIWFATGVLARLGYQKH